MRIAAAACLSLILAGCATVIAPREYLDEKTAATITVVAQPWIFTSDAPHSNLSDRDYLNLYAIDVNRMGEHRQYIAVMQSFYAQDSVDETSAPTLELQSAGRTFSLLPSTETPRQLGIAQPLAEPFAQTSRWWYFPVSREDLAAVAQAKNLQAALVMNNARLGYVVFRDGSVELSEMSATLR
jgi:hypothetical protein